jgi:hypothetical protein
MKYLVVIVAGLVVLPSLGSAAQPAHHVQGLRQVLQQYHPGGPSPARQLTPQERAELRRQLAEQPRRPPPRKNNTNERSTR